MKTKQLKSETVKNDVWIPTVCGACTTRCGLKVHRVNGVVVGIKGNPDSPMGKGKACAKAISGTMGLYNPNRLKTPLKRTNPEKGIGVDPKWEEISWEEALDTIAQKLKKLREEDPRKLVGLSFDTDYFRSRLPAIFGAAFGSPNLYNAGPASFFCGNGLHFASYLTHGSFHKEPDLHYCNYLILIGAQHGAMVGEDAVVVANSMADARARGMKVIVVDPICTPIAAKAEEWLPIRPGTDAAFALAIINVLLNDLGIYDAEFIKKQTNGAYLIGPDGHYLRDKATRKPLIWDAEEAKAKTYDDPGIKNLALEGKYKVNGTDGTPSFQLLKEHVKKYTCEEVAKITTIPAETMRRIAQEFGEAAQIGSKIVIEGKELPYRPVCIHPRKGASAHKHSALSCISIQLLNIIVGAIDVPGGSLNVSGTLLPSKFTRQSWVPKEDQDGMMVTAYPGSHPYPAREVKRPENCTLFELFPMATYADPLMLINLMDPEKFQLPYEPEVLQHCRTNIVMCTVDPQVVAECLKKFSFQFSFAMEMNETVAFADIVLPDAHFLERLDPVIAFTVISGPLGPGGWCFQVRQPVVEPPPNVRPWIEVLFELADRVGYLRDVYHGLNVIHKMKEPYKFDLDKKYSWPEVVDMLCKSWYGPEHDLAWFKEHSFISWPKKVEEVYPTPFGKARIPIYLEHFLQAGQDVKRVTEEMGLTEWDVSDYQALLDWKPCPAYEQKDQDYDLYVANYKLPFHFFTVTPDNIWLDELTGYHPYAYYILINSQTAQKKGIKDRDVVRLQTQMGNQVEGVVKVTECVHPEVVGLAGTFGHLAKGIPITKRKGVHFNSLIPLSLENTDMVSTSVDCCVKVKVSKVSEAQK